MSEAKTTGLSFDEATSLADQAIRPYVTAMALQDTRKGEVKFIGSGTFVKWGNNYGILTAEHVVNNPDVSALSINTKWTSEQILLLTLDQHPNDFGFDANGLHIFTTGKRLSAEEGPDLAVIVLPPSAQLQTLLAKRSFWPLDLNSQINLERAMITIPCMAVVGHPAEDVAPADPRPGFKDLTYSEGLIGYTQQHDYFTIDPYDYIEVLSEHTKANQAPLSYKGVSGGSLWRVHISREEGEAERFRFDGVTFAGVPFHEFPFNESPGHWRIRGHGPRSIYLELLRHLG